MEHFMEMNMAKFSEKLQELVELGKKKKNVLEYQEINDHCKEMPLDPDALDKVFDYLESCGIDVLRIPDSDEDVFIISDDDGINLDEEEEVDVENIDLSVPEGVSIEEGDKWFYEQFVPAFQAMPEVTRMVSSKIIKDINGCPMDRMVEIWFDGPEEWATAMEAAKKIAKPAWAQTDAFPYLMPYQNIMGGFVTDYVTSDNLTSYHGYITMR